MGTATSSAGSGDKNTIWRSESTANCGMLIEDAIGFNAIAGESIAAAGAGLCAPLSVAVVRGVWIGFAE